jgi:hypothetical protein
MAITTVAGAIAGAQPPVRYIKNTAVASAVQGNWTTHWYTATEPPTGAAGSAGLGGEALTSVTGQIPWHNPPSGNTYLFNSRIWAHSSSGINNGSYLICDRLWQNSGIVVTDTAAQTIDSVAWPARDMNASTNGAGVWIALEVSTVTGAGAATPVIEYTNSAGSGTKTGTCARYSASAAAGRLCFFDLAAGDVGVRSIQTITLGTSLTSGVVHLVALRPICFIATPSTTGPPRNDYLADILRTGFAQLYDNSVLQVVAVPNVSMNTAEFGSLTFAQG